MKHPALTINKTKLTQNIKVIQELCRQNNINFCAVTKVFCAHPKITQVYYDAGIRDFADSRIENLKTITYPDCTRLLLRLPMLSEANEVVKYSDISLNSEIAVIKSLSKAAQKLGKTHKIILMIDMGDLREGVIPLDAVDTALAIIKLPNIQLYGVGVNYNCYGGVIPSPDSLDEFIRIAEEIEKACGIKLQIISAGNSGAMHFLTSKTMPKRANHLRIGEVILIGIETSYQQHIKRMYTDVLQFNAEIIELKKKPSMPIGETGLNAFGERTVFEDKGDMMRAIVACGRQDVAIDAITPLDHSINIIGQSSDHIIIDLTDAAINYKIGDIISFKVSYGSILSLSTSKYVNKIII